MLINLMTDTGPVDVSGYADLHKHALRLEKDALLRIVSSMPMLCKGTWVKSRGARTGSRTVL